MNQTLVPVNFLKLKGDRRARISPPMNKGQTTRKRYNMSSDHWKQTSQLIPNYKHLSSDQFKCILMKAIPQEYHTEIEH